MNIYDLAVKSHIENITDIEFEYILSNQNGKYLYVEDNILKLHYKDKELFIDFNSSEILNRIDPKTKKCSIVQAVEGRSKDKLNILDTTAGLGRDTFTLAARGHRLTSLEKDCYIYVLLVDALHRARQTHNLKDIANQIDLINIDANEHINTTNISFDCIYIDPMFPPRNKSAKVKQGMQVLHDIAFNNDESNSNLLKNIILSKKQKSCCKKTY